MKRWLYIALMAALGIGMVACGQADTNGQTDTTSDRKLTDSGLTQMTGEELRRRIIGASMSSVEPHQLGLLTFGCSGEWWTFKGYVTATGRYAFRDNQVCLDGKNGEDLGACFIILRDQAGKYFAPPLGGEMVVRGAPIGCLRQPQLG